MPVLLTENTLCAIGFSIAATHWIILLGADFPFITATVRLDTNRQSNDYTINIRLVSQ